MTTYPDEAYQPVMDFYGKLPKEKKDDANKILSDFSHRYKQGEAPPEEMLNSLKALVNEEGSLDAKVNAVSAKGISFNKADNAIGLAGIIGTMAAFAAGAYPLGIATALLAGVYLLKGKYQTKLKPA